MSFLPVKWVCQLFIANSTNKEKKDKKEWPAAAWGLGALQRRQGPIFFVLPEGDLEGDLEDGPIGMQACLSVWTAARSMLFNDASKV